MLGNPVIRSRAFGVGHVAIQIYIIIIAIITIIILYFQLTKTVILYTGKNHIEVGMQNPDANLS